MIQQKFVDEIFELLIIGKYVKIRSKNWESPFYFFSSKDLKIKNITKTEPKRLFFVYLLGFIFYGVPRAKTDLHNKNMIKLCVCLILSIKLTYFTGLCKNMT